MDTGDVVQEAIVGVLRNLGELDGADQETLKRYLIVAIQNRICDEVRRAQIGEVTNGGTGRQPDTRPSPHEEAVEDEYQQQYRAALLQLSDDEQRQNTAMPWTQYAGMTREDLGAIYTYLRTVKPVTHRVDKWPDARPATR